MHLQKSSKDGSKTVLHHLPRSTVSRRMFLRRMLLGACAGAAVPFHVDAQSASTSFEAWRDAFRHRAAARGVSEATYGRVRATIKPDTSVSAEIRSQPE